MNSPGISEPVCAVTCRMIQFVIFYLPLIPLLCLLVLSMRILSPALSLITLYVLRRLVEAAGP